MIAITLIVYWSGLSGPFLVDDTVNVVENYVDDFNLDEILYVATHNQSGIFGRPISVLSLLFSGIVHGPDTWGYKYHNLMIHLINGLLIFWILIKVLLKINSRLSQKEVLLIAGTTTLCWLLHPLMISTVLYVVQRMAQLSALFTLVAMLAYMFARESSAKNDFKYYFLSYFIFPVTLILAVLSKENGALIPFYILMMEFIVYKFKSETTGERIRVFSFQIIFSILPIVVGSLYLLTHLDEFTNYAARDFSLAERLLTQLHVIFFYIKLILLPKLSDMSLFHDGWPIVAHMDVLTLFLLMVLISIVGMIFYFRTKAPVLAFGIAWFFVSHLMESTVFSLELVFEHRNYLASLGLLFVLIYYCYTSQMIKGLKIVPFLIVILLTVMSIIRVSEWKDAEVIYSVAVKDHPESVRAHTVYASLLYGHGNVEEALEHIEKVVELDKTDFGGLLMQVGYGCGSGRQVEHLFERAMSRARQYPVSVYGVFSIDAMINSLNLGRCPEITPEQLLLLIQAATEQKDNAENKLYLGFLQGQAGRLYYYMGDFVQGFENMISAYENTDLTGILMELINIQIQINSLESAEQLISLLEERDKYSVRSEAFFINDLKVKLEQAQQKQLD